MALNIHDRSPAVRRAEAALVRSVTLIAIGRSPIHPLWFWIGDEHGGRCCRCGRWTDWCRVQCFRCAGERD